MCAKATLSSVACLGQQYFSTQSQKHYYYHHHHISIMGLGHLLKRKMCVLIFSKEFN